VPGPSGTTGWTFPAGDAAALADRLDRTASLTTVERIEIGNHARAIASTWGPSRFAEGLLQALDHATSRVRPRVGRPATHRPSLVS
jgi:hypothetical protein